MIRFGEWTIDRKALTITRGSYYYIFNGKRGAERKHIVTGNSGRFSITEHLILSGGRATRQSIFEHVYGDDPDGGPIQGTKQIDVMLNHMSNLVFPKLGCVCVHDRRGGQMWYELRPVASDDVVRRTA